MRVCARLHERGRVDERKNCEALRRGCMRIDDLKRHESFPKLLLRFSFVSFFLSFFRLYIISVWVFSFEPLWLEPHSLSAKKFSLSFSSGETCFPLSQTVPPSYLCRRNFEIWTPAQRYTVLIFVDTDTCRNFYRPQSVCHTVVIFSRSLVVVVVVVYVFIYTYACLSVQVSIPCLTLSVHSNVV